MTTNQPAPHSPQTQPGNPVMAAENRGKVLQRGGEELLLEKVDDRFVVNAVDQAAAKELAKHLPAQVKSGVAPPKMTEFMASPGQINQAMQTARQDDSVNYASHVYQFKNQPGSRVYLTNQLTVQFVPQLNSDAIHAIAVQTGLAQIKAIAGVPNAFVFQLTPTATENPLKIANALMQRLDVMTAEPNVIIKAQSHYRPKDSLYPKQWHLSHTGGSELAANSHIFAETAWDLTRGTRSIVVAVMDDGVDLNHPDFQGVGKIVAPRDFKGNDFMPLPEESNEDHGTACAGVAVAEENGYGAVGVAPGCALMPIRTTGYLDDDAIEELFDWAVTKGAAVISCSWGPSAVYFPLSLRQRAALTNAATQGRNGKGCVIVFAAGNANRPTNGTVNETGWPNNTLTGATNWMGGFTNHPDVITVAASTSMGKKAAYSNWGPDITVCGPSNNAPPGVGLPNLGYVYTPPEVTAYMPGLGVVTTDRIGTSGYDASNFTNTFGGTSSACPLVAGVAALVLSANPDLTAAEVRQILQQTADKIIDKDADPQLGLRKGTYEGNGRCDWFGYGKVNAAKAVQMAVQKRIVPMGSPKSIMGQNPAALTIPDNNAQGITSTIPIGDVGNVRDLQVTVDIDHGYLGDLEISLIAPSGKVALLQGRTLGRQTKLKTTYTQQTAPALRRLLGQPIQGAWKLQIIDAIPRDDGKLNSWKLTIGG
jgi:subtilisin family serine protease/subtilisin-like proprotein convertase family protein